jgi:hypothetical protein
VPLLECRAAITHEPGRAVIAEYTDEALSAFRASRGPGLADAMEHAEELAKDGGVAELWALHSDRLARGDGRAARHAGRARSSFSPLAPARAISSSAKRSTPRLEFALPLGRRTCSTSPLPARLAISG